MTEVMTEPNCIEIAAPFRDELGLRPDLPDVQIMGGIGSAALKHPGTRILVDERRIVAPDDFLEDEGVSESLARFRTDGTLRDFDLLVHSADPQAIAEVEDIAAMTVDGQLDISAFGLHDAEELDQQIENPLGFFAVRTFVSDRYLYEDGNMKKSLFPFAVPLEREVLENWTLEVGDQEFQVSNPASTILNYLTRSISGIRGVKDGPKVQAMAAQIFSKAPELADWCVDGPGQSQMELAGILQTLRRSDSLPKAKRTLDVGGVLKIKAGSVRALADHEAFMIPDVDANVRDAVLALSVAKSRLLGYGESQQWVITLYQKHIERLLDGITKNSPDGAFAS